MVKAVEGFCACAIAPRAAMKSAAQAATKNIVSTACSTRFVRMVIPAGLSALFVVFAGATA